MADKKQKQQSNRGIDEHDLASSSAVASTTEATPSVADESSAPGPYSGADKPQVNEPPVRTNRPDTPIAQSLVAGAGQHDPPSEDEVGPDGRPVYDEKAASEAGEGERVKAEDAK